MTKTSMTRLNTNLIAQYGALAALRDTNYVSGTEKLIRENYRRVRDILEGTDGISIPVEPSYGFSMVADVGGTGATAQELTVSLFKRKIAVYPGDGLGDSGALDYIRLNFSHSDRMALEKLESSLGEAVEEARTGVYREDIVRFFERRENERAKWILRKLKKREKDRRAAC